MADNEVVNGVIDKILTPILAILEWIIKVVFSNHVVLVLVFLILINLIAIILMKKDKEFAESGQRRVREATLLIVALIGGSLGMYYAMFKCKHKTLHNKFSIGIPVIIVIQFAYIAYMIMQGILV